MKKEKEYYSKSGTIKRPFKVRWVQVIFFAFLMCFVGFGVYAYVELNNSFSEAKTNIKLKSDTIKLKSDTISLLKNKNKYIESLTYKQFYVYKVSGCLLPNYFKEEWVDDILYWNKKYGVPDSITFRIAKHESGFRLDVIQGLKLGSLGEISMFQLLPRNCEILYKLLNLNPSIESWTQMAIYMLRQCYEQNDRDWRKAVSTYGCGSVKDESEFLNFVFERKEKRF